VTRLLLPDQEVHDIVLEPEERVTLGPGAGSAPLAAGRIQLARPVALRIDVNAVDADTRPFLEQNSHREYYLVGLGCSFRHDQAQPLVSAWLQVELGLVGGDSGGIVSAWSLQPEQLAAAAEVTNGVELDPTLKLKPLGALGLDVGVSGKKTTQAQFSRGLIFLEGLGAGTASPAWSFTRTDAQEIRGAFRLRFVAELSEGRAAEALVSVGATIETKGRLGRSYVAHLTDVPELAHIHLGAANAG
jgi:hypothetical protein